MIYVAGKVEVDVYCYELRRDGHHLPIQPQVFNVLHYLIVNRHRVVTKAELLEALWPNQHVSESTLTQRIRAARRALEDSRQRPHYIKTVYGRGYRFIAPVEEHHPVPPTTEPISLETPPVPIPARPCPRCHPVSAARADNPEGDQAEAHQAEGDQINYRHLIETTLTSCAQRLAASRRLRIDVVFDHCRNRYLLINVGWDHNRRVYRNRVHIDVLGDQVCIQHNDTNIDLVAALMQAGIAASNIVLGYCPPKSRPRAWDRPL